MHGSARSRLERQRIRAREAAFAPEYRDWEPRSLEERLASARERRARELEEDQGELPTPDVAAARAAALSRMIPERELFLRIFSGNSPMSRRRAVLTWRRLVRVKREQQAGEQAGGASLFEGTNETTGTESV
jgi:hypothetical protein